MIGGGTTGALLRLIATGIKLGDLRGDPPELRRFAGKGTESGREEILGEELEMLAGRQGL